MNTVVYEWRRKNVTPYYVGIGKPQRPYTGRRRCGPPPPKDRIFILHENLDWQTACKIEKELIAFYGRKDLGTGILRNMTDGGDGVHGLVVSEETKAKLSGKNHHMYGKKHTEKHKLKVSRALSGKNHYRYTPRDWYHPEHGEIIQKSLSDLIKMFPEQKLYASHLSRVANNDLFQHGGWRLLKNKNVQKRRKNNISRNWYHPDYGEILHKSATELKMLFTSHRLTIQALSEVSRGKRPQHKSWRLLYGPIALKAE